MKYRSDKLEMALGEKYVYKTIRAARRWRRSADWEHVYLNFPKCVIKG